MVLSTALIASACSGPTEPQVTEDPASASATNPLLDASTLPYGAPDFTRLRDEHFEPAMEQGMAAALTEIRRIADNPEPATFDNTLTAWERSGEVLERAQRVFFQLNSADGNDARQAVAREMAPRLAAHEDAILLDPALFARVQSLYQQRDRLELTSEQARLLERRYSAMLRAGAALPEDGRARMREINQDLARLGNQYQDNFRDDGAAFHHHVSDPAHVAGLPDDLLERAATEAQSRGHESGWAFTLAEPVVFGVLESADHRPLREAIYRAYKNRGNNRNEFDNSRIAGEMAALRAERAELLGFGSHAHFVADDNMAGHPDTIMEMLERLWAPGLANARAEAERLQQQVDAAGDDFKLAPWDWWYYAEAVRSDAYDFDSEALRPYFELNRVRDGAFLLAERLWGVSFQARDDIPVYHPDVQVFEMFDTDGRGMGLVYFDFLARPSKRFGAWMSSFQLQSRLRGTAPIVTNTSNFGPASNDDPVLLSYEQARTLFHEFGHAVHGLFSDVNFPSLSGTAVARDFVELPAQLLENWVPEPALLSEFARHYETGEPIPTELVEAMLAAQRFNEGFAVTEYLASSLVDMAWHTRDASAPIIEDAIAFEDRVMAGHGLIPQILPRHRSTHFSHIFPGGYSAGYYSYIWAQVLDADAFEAFREQGLFDRQLGQRLRESVLAVGGSRDPMEAYLEFRGATPSIRPLLERRGLVVDDDND
ncbi:MAG: M3 family metallopeptidase [Gammaproteobacteria bacterium]|nr:M3 family metallopeptidase [Gammaproteobacteria bacterium]